MAYSVAANVSGAEKSFLRDFAQVFIVGAAIAAIFLWRVHTLLKGILEDMLVSSPLSAIR